MTDECNSPLPPIPEYLRQPQSHNLKHTQVSALAKMLADNIRATTHHIKTEENESKALGAKCARDAYVKAANELYPAPLDDLHDMSKALDIGDHRAEAWLRTLESKQLPDPPPKPSFKKPQPDPPPKPSTGLIVDMRINELQHKLDNHRILNVILGIIVICSLITLGVSAAPHP